MRRDMYVCMYRCIDVGEGVMTTKKVKTVCGLSDFGIVIKIYVKCLGSWGIISHGDISTVLKKLPLQKGVRC